MPQTLSLADLQSAPATGQTLTIDDLAPAPAAAPKPEVKIPHFQDAAIPFFKSMYDEGLAPIVEMAKDAINRGDVGEHSAQQLLGAFKDQLWNFQQHPDIRNLPLIGPGATAVANRMQRQYNDGDYAGAAGSAFGFLSAFLQPEALGKIAETMPEATQAAAAAADATGNVIKAGAKATAAGAKAAAPDLAIAGLKGAASKVLGSHVPLAAFMGEMGALKQAGRGVVKGAQAFGDAWTAERAAQRAAAAGEEAAPEAAAAEVPVQTGEATPDIWAGAKAQNAARDATVTPNVWEKARAANAPAAATLTLEDLDRLAAAPVTAEERAAGDVIDIRPEARTETPAPATKETTEPAAAEPETDLEAQLKASIEAANAKKAQAAAAPASDVPALTPEQALEDRIHEHHAYLAGQAEDIIWANRARKADRFAQFLIENKLDATPENIATATKQLAEKAPPSAETVPMIQHRVDWYHGRQSDYGQPTAAADLYGEPAGENLDAGTAGARQSVYEQTRPGARPVRAAGDRTDVEIPRESNTYPARYEVRELSEVQPSHNPHNFNENPRYEYENDRNYDDPENQRKVIEWSQSGPAGFKARNMLNTAPDSSSGPPVIDSRGNVLGGNGRSMILGRVYESNPQGAAAYRAELDRTASHYGIDPESYAHMQQPVLVRTLDPEAIATPEQAQQAITDFNKTGTAALTPAERAIADARRVSVNTLEDISRRMDAIGPDATLAQALEGKSGGEVLGKLMDDGVISPQEGAQLRRNGVLTRAGQDRISGLMLGRFFSNAQQLDSLPAALRNKMERIAAPLARVEGNPAYSLSPQIRRALDLIEDAAAHNMELEHLTKQSGFFSQHNYPPDVVALAKNLDERNPNALTQAVRDYAARAKYAEEYRGPGMFGDIPEPVSPGAAFRESFSDEAIEREAKAAAEAKAKRREKKTAQQ